MLRFKTENCIFVIPRDASLQKSSRIACLKSRISGCTPACNQPDRKRPYIQCDVGHIPEKCLGMTNIKGFHSVHPPVSLGSRLTCSISLFPQRPSCQLPLGWLPHTLHDPGMLLPCLCMPEAHYILLSLRFEMVFAAFQYD